MQKALLALLVAVVAAAAFGSEEDNASAIRSIQKGLNNDKQIKTLRVRDDATVGRNLTVAGTLGVTGGLAETDVNWMTTTITAVVTNGEEVSLGDLVVKGITSAGPVTNTIAVPGAGSTVGRPVTLFQNSTNLIAITLGASVFGKDTEIVLDDMYDSITITKYDDDHWLLINKNLP